MQRKKGNQKGETKKKRKRLLGVIGLICVILLLLCCVILSLDRPEKAPETRLAEIFDFRRTHYGSVKNKVIFRVIF